MIVFQLLLFLNLSLTESLLLLSTIIVNNNKYKTNPIFLLDTYSGDKYGLDNSVLWSEKK